MVLVDTSVWVRHFREKDPGLKTILLAGRVVCHPFVIGELACGNLRNRGEILSYLQELPQAAKADDSEVLELLERQKLMGHGLGYIDLHLLASACLSRVGLWTLDGKLQRAAQRLTVAY